jgi:hypothetical protein
MYLVSVSSHSEVGLGELAASSGGLRGGRPGLLGSLHLVSLVNLLAAESEQPVDRAAAQGDQGRAREEQWKLSVGFW